MADTLTRTVGAEVPLLGHVPIDPLLVSAGDDGVPLVLSAPDSPAGQELRKVADALSSRKRGWQGCRWAWIGRTLARRWAYRLADHAVNGIISPALIAAAV